MRILITSALPYANGLLHFGHIAGAYLPGDCYARSQRLLGHEVLYLCGSDEYGVAITLSADRAGRTPQQQVDFFHPKIKTFFDQLGMSFDHYSRTTCPLHAPTVQEFYRDLKEKGLIEAKTEKHLYSEKEGRFLADRYVVGTCPRCGHDPARGDECPKCGHSYEATELKNPRSVLTNSPLTLRPSEHLYLRFDRFKDELKQWLLSKDWKESVVNFAMGYVENLKPRAITRDSDWGVPVPDMRGKVFYVWFDAPIGYVTAAKEWAEKTGGDWKKYWLDQETKLVHFIGKDNIPFHAVFFPAMLMGQKLPYKLPDEVPANEFYLLEGRQFSKSDNWTIDTEEFFEHYTPDQIRYAIAANAPETSDSEFSWKDFQVRCNAELLNKYGNFVQRVLKFAHMKCGGKVPPKKNPENEFTKQMDTLVAVAAQNYSAFHLRKATQTIMELAQAANAYFDAKKPWTVKDQSEIDTIIAVCIECVKNLALIASPIIPATAQKIWEMLGQKGELAKGNWDQIHRTPIPPGQALGEPVHLFRKVEDSEIEQQLAKLTPPAPPAPTIPVKNAITKDEFDKMDIRIGQIIDAENVPKSKKLLKLTVDFGSERRTIVSGIAMSYEPAQLIGKKVPFIVNLPPATLMGIESQGMILAAKHGAGLELPTIQSLAPGAQLN
jgi:methionyl-tRNA synthetase